MRIVGPPRNTYELDVNTREVIDCYGLKVTQSNFVIDNQRKENLHCSFYMETRLADLTVPTERPCVIFMHGSQGNKQSAN